MEVGRVHVGNNFEIHLRKEFRNGLIALEGFGHIMVVWWANQVDNIKLRAIMTVDKPYVNGPEQVGIFATRSPMRPNPICISVVDILDIDYEKGIITTTWIDAEDQTPIVDLKAYYPCSDVIREPKMPDWGNKLPTCVEDSANYDWSGFFNF